MSLNISIFTSKSIGKNKLYHSSQWLYPKYLAHHRSGQEFKHRRQMLVFEIIILAGEKGTVNKYLFLWIEWIISDGQGKKSRESWSRNFDKILFQNCCAHIITIKTLWPFTSCHCLERRETNANVELRMGAVAWSPVSYHRSSNRTIYWNRCIPNFLRMSAVPKTGDTL